MKHMTMTEFRRQPGEALLDVRRDGQSITLTKSGNAVARLVPPDDVLVLGADGTTTPRDADAEKLLAAVALLRHGAGY